MKPFCLSLLLACVPALAHEAPACVGQCGYEAEPVLDAAAVAEPALLSGPNFAVDPKAPVGGYMARFSVTTSWGPLTADSAQLLAIRVAEVPAIEALDRATRSGAFAHALAERGRRTGTAIANVVRHPVDAVVGLPMGVVRYFKKQIDMWAGRAQAVSDRSARIMENKGDPFRAPAGPMTAGRDVPADAAVSANAEAHRPDRPDALGYVGVDAPPVDAGDAQGIPPPPAEPPEKESHAWYARLGRDTGREVKRYLKYSASRNEIAKRLGFDPGTSNPYIVERLNSLAWAATWGNFSAGEALGQIDGIAADVIVDSGMVNEFVLNHTPEQIRERNRKQLLTVCSDEFGIRQFLRRGGFSDTTRTQLVDSLVAIAPEEGCNELLELGATTRGEVEARFLVDALSQIRRYRPDARGGKLVVADAALAYVARDRRLLLPLPLDYLSWTADIAGFFDRAEFGSAADKTVLIGGEASALARRKLAARGWHLVLRAPFAGAPKYPPGEFTRTVR
ncbi:MAG: hypothetical protein QM741_17555 [Rudaea sp.]|uniref:hypothetical protein n=1 Tax=Rudaea sp. TaxID=2136325 RepID=UPI0039E38141